MKENPAGQLSLTGFEDPQPLSDRLFFALRPDPVAMERVERLAETLTAAHGLKGRPLGAHRFHVTLYHMGDFAGLPQAVLNAAGEAARSVASTSPFTVRFDRAASFARRSGRRPLVLLGDEGMEALIAFQRTLAMALGKKPQVAPPEPSYTPHLTLLYDPRHVDDQPIDPIVWTARDFVLVHSLIGQGRHEVLERWALSGPES